MKRVISVLLLTLLAGALLVYTGARSYDLLSRTLPESQSFLAWFALAAFDAGLVLWACYFKFGATGSWQRGTALLMVGVSLIAVGLAFGADTLIGAGERGTVTAADPVMVNTVLLATVAVVILNVAAVTTCHLADPDGLRAAAEQEARDKIEDAARRQIAENADSLAAELAPVVGLAWVQRMRAATLESLPDDLRATYARRRVSGAGLGAPGRDDYDHGHDHGPEGAPDFLAPAPEASVPSVPSRNGHGRL